MGYNTKRKLTLSISIPKIRERERERKGHSINLNLFLKDLYTIRILTDIRDEGLLDLLAFTTSDAEDQIVKGGSAEDVDMVA